MLKTSSIGSSWSLPPVAWRVASMAHRLEVRSYLLAKRLEDSRTPIR